MSYIANSLYGKYLSERQSAKIIENSLGFIVYKFIEDECHILETYVVPEERRKGSFKRLFERLKDEAILNKSKYITAEIQMNDPMKDSTLAAALHLGFYVALLKQGAMVIAMDLFLGEG